MARISDKAVFLTGVSKGMGKWLRPMLWWRCCAAIMVLLVAMTVTPAAAEGLSGNHLIMVTASNCPWCEAFEDEVGNAYSKTEESQILPLRRHDIFDELPVDMAALLPATMTPTFIVIRDGVEAGRIVGYPGAELFWWRLSEFTKPHPASTNLGQ